MRQILFLWVTIFMTTGCGLMSALREKRDFETIGIEGSLTSGTIVLNAAFKELDSCLMGIEDGNRFREMEIAGELKIEKGYLSVSTIEFSNVNQIPNIVSDCLSKAKNKYQRDLRRFSYRGFDPVNKVYVYRYSGFLRPKISGRIWSDRTKEIESF